MVDDLLGSLHAWVVCCILLLSNPYLTVGPILPEGLALVTVCPICLPDGCVESARYITG